MVQADGVEAYIIRYDDKARYAEYVVPKDSPAYTGRSNEVYIEAETGVRFAIVVRRGREFKWLKCAHVKTKCYVGTGDAWRIISQSSTAKGPISTNKEHVFERRKEYIDGAWHSCGYTFSELGLDEDLDLYADEIARDARCHGRIVVEVTRGNAVVLPIPEIHSPRPLTNVTVSSKEVVKGKNVSHAIQLLPISESTPSQNEHDFTAAPKPTGNPIRFVFYARSKTALQLMKIVPEDDMEAPSQPALESLPDKSNERIEQNTPETPAFSRPGLPNVEGADQEASSAPAGEQPSESTHDPQQTILDEISATEPHDTDDEIEIVSVRKASEACRSSRSARIRTEQVKEEPMPTRVKRERSPEVQSPTAPNATPSAEPHSQTANRRKKARLELQLEEIRIRARRDLEELEVRKQMAELEDSE